MCLYDLQKAFDSVENPVLITGETFLCQDKWQVVETHAESWYDEGSCQFKLASYMLMISELVRSPLKYGCF